jgi:hypothetical protein
LHVPFLQRSPWSHVTPQAPQFLSSLVVSMHLPAQLDWPGGQDVTQMPSWHSAPLPPHIVVQSPQCALSCARSTQALPHAVSVPPQLKVQLPSLQSGVAPGGAVQERAQAPQFELSSFVSTHEPLQFVVPAEQRVTQAPALQTAPSPQTRSQSPQ